MLTIFINIYDVLLCLPIMSAMIDEVKRLVRFSFYFDIYFNFVQSCNGFLTYARETMKIDDRLSKEIREVSSVESSV